MLDLCKVSANGATQLGAPSGGGGGGGGGENDGGLLGLLCGALCKDNAIGQAFGANNDPGGGEGVVMVAPSSSGEDSSSSCDLNL